MLRRCCQTFLYIVFSLAMIVPSISQAAGKPNIVLVTLGSTRADRMGFLGAKTKTSPNLDSLAGQSMVFEQAFSQAPLTVVSHATILSGTYPQTNRASEFGSRLAATLPLHSRSAPRTRLPHGCICRVDRTGSEKRIRSRLRSRLFNLRRRISVFRAGIEPRPLRSRVRRRRSWLAAPPG